MDRNFAADLDRHITGNWGEDQFKEYPDESWPEDSVPLVDEETKGRGLKLANQYSSAFGTLYAKTPKAVFAAIALSLAMRLNEDQEAAALAEFINEWRVLHQNGIIPQRPPK